MTLTVDDLRGHVDSSLSDTALGLLLDAAYEAIDRAIGADGAYDDSPPSVSEYLTVGPGPLLMLSRSASAITVVTERGTELDPDDYALTGDQLLRRLDDGTHPRSRWCSPVEVTYEALGNANDRDRAAIGLVKLDLDYQPGVASERLGDHSITFATGSGEYLAQREAILASLVSGFIAK